jgi:hypothetical protein
MYKKVLLFAGMAVACFQEMQAQTPAELKAMLPAVKDWTISEKTEVFNSENLFERINGSAPLFLENNFREMTSMEYVKGSEYITIQAYRHATPEDAFGMYASERSPELEFFPVGGEAQGDESGIYLFAGNIYLKMWSSAADKETGETLLQIAGAFAGKIDQNATYPAVIKAFPSEDKIPHTEAYITSNYIGHEFLKGVYTVKYRISGKEYQAFAIDAKTKQEARGILEKYFTFTKQTLDFEEGALLVKDRYNGDMPLVWKGQYIAGIFSEDGKAPGEAAAFLAALTEKLF